jgi:CubicO group peptidase (beta-lactamase class C family)
VIKTVACVVVAAGLVTAAVCVRPAPVAAQAADPVKRVFEGLRPPVAVVGRPRVQWSMADRMEAHHVPGASVAIIDRGRIVWAGGFGVLQARTTQPVTASTLFQAQSISKVVTATAALRLTEAGKLSLDAPVNTLLTSWRLPDNEFQANEKVTLRRLLSHSAGVSVGGFAGYRLGQQLPTLIQILDGIPPANNPPIRVNAVPGSISSYSGGGIMILQQLLMDVSGESFPALMNRLVLSPAGMALSTFDQPLPAARLREAASGHDGSGAVVEGGRPVQPELAAGGLWTTPTELARWAIDIADAWNGRSAKLLSTTMAKEMLSVQKEPFGLGPEVDGTGDAVRFGHSGSIWGFRARFVMYPATGHGAVVLTNGDGGDALIGELLTSIATEYKWPTGRQEERATVSLTAAQLDALVGRYALPPAPNGAAVYLDVSREGQQLYAALIGLGSNPPTPIYPATADSFFMDSGLAIVFARNDAGRGVSLNLGQIKGTRQP